MNKYNELTSNVDQEAINKLKFKLTSTMKLMDIVRDDIILVKKDILSPVAHKGISEEELINYFNELRDKALSLKNEIGDNCGRFCIIPDSLDAKI